MFLFFFEGLLYEIFQSAVHYVFGGKELWPKNLFTNVLKEEEMRSYMKKVLCDHIDDKTLKNLDVDIAEQVIEKWLQNSENFQQYSFWVCFI